MIPSIEAIGACVNQLLGSDAGWLILGSDNLGLAGLIILWTIALASLSSPFFMSQYRHRVLRFMRFHQVAPFPGAWWDRRRARRQGSRRPGEGPFTHALPEAMRLRRRRIALATAVAGAVFVAGTLLVSPFDADRPLTQAAGAMFVVLLLASGPALTNVRPEAATLLAWVGMGVIVPVMLTLSSMGGSADAVVLAMWLTGALQAPLVSRSLRALFVPLCVLSLGVLLGLQSIRWSFVPGQCATLNDPRYVSLAAASSIGPLLGLMAFGLCIWLALLALRGLDRLWARGYVSDISLVTLAGWCFTAALFGAYLDAQGTAPAWLWVGTLLWLLAALGSYLLVLRSLPAPRAVAPRLLVLRVFSDNPSTDDFIDAVQTRWRYAGPVLQIAGPDLAKLNVNPRSFLSFVSMSTHELFLPESPAGRDLLDDLDFAPDREGRFRVNEVFCFDSAWRSTVRQLIEFSDAVLLDLRGFERRREGTAYEIELLANGAHLGKVVAVGDAKTDWSYLDTLAASLPVRSARELRLPVTRWLVASRYIEPLLERALRSKSGHAPASA